MKRLIGKNGEEGSRMRALRFQQFGSPDEVLEVQTISRPKAQADEVVIDIYAAGIEPSDVKNVQGEMAKTTLPRTPGRDFAGMIFTRICGTPKEEG
jgi:NADPH:quinone reductase-like Zn-dependent oxidoreductase